LEPRTFTELIRFRLATPNLAALPATRAIETRLLPSSLAATHRGFAFYVAFPNASFPKSRRVLCRSSHSGDHVSLTRRRVFRAAQEWGDRVCDWGTLRSCRNRILRKM